MPTSSTSAHVGNYRRPHVSGVANGRDMPSGEEDTGEDEEWSDEPDEPESSYFSRSRPSRSPPLDSYNHDRNFAELQNRMVRRIKAQPARDHLPSTPDPDYGRYWDDISARTSRRRPNMSSNSPGGQTVRYGPSYPTANPFETFPEQYTTDPGYHSPQSRYAPPRPQSRHVPPPPQYYPSAYPEVETIRQELEDMKMEKREKEKLMEKRRAEEDRRKKKKKAEIEQKRMAKQQEEDQKLAFETKMQQMKVEFDKRLESVSRAATNRDQAADLHDLLRNFAPPQPIAGPYRNSYEHDAQDRLAHGMSTIMRRLDELTATERQAPPFRWFDRQEPTIYNNQYLIDDLRNQIGAMERRERSIERRLSDYEQMLGGLLTHQQEYDLVYRRSDPRSHPSYPLMTNSRSIPAQAPRRRLLKKARVGRSHGGEPYSPSSDVEDRDYSDGAKLTPEAVADHSRDEHQQAAETMSTKARKKHPLPQLKVNTKENNNVTRVDRNSMVTQQIGAGREEYSPSLGTSSDNSDEVEVCKPRSTLYSFTKSARREESQSKYQPPRAPSPPSVANEDL